LYQVVCEARFTEDDVEAEKRMILEELQQTPDPRTNLNGQFEKLLFHGTTYGRPLMGIPEIVATLTSGDVRYFYRKYFSPGDASLVVVGNVSPEQVLQKATRIWGLWVRKDRVPFTFAPAREPAEDIYLIEDDPGSSAVQFILGSFSPPRSNPIFGNVMLSARILQQRLRQILPTSLLTVGLEGRRMPGAFSIQGQAAAAREEGGQFVDAVRSDGVDIVAMSALLTTTMPQMEVTIKALKEAGVRDNVKVMIGGAPVTATYAADIGADGFAQDAGQAASLAKSLLS